MKLIDSGRNAFAHILCEGCNTYLFTGWGEAKMGFKCVFVSTRKYAFWCDECVKEGKELA
jgi:hypothetical protein